MKYIQRILRRVKYLFVKLDIKIRSVRWIVARLGVHKTSLERIKGIFRLVLAILRASLRSSCSRARPVILDIQRTQTPSFGGRNKVPYSREKRESGVLLGANKTRSFRSPRCRFVRNDRAFLFPGLQRHVYYRCLEARRKWACKRGCWHNSGIFPEILRKYQFTPVRIDPLCRLFTKGK